MSNKIPLKTWPFIAAHFAPLAAFYTGLHLIDLVVCFGMYFLQMFLVTGVYHRYFSHRSYKMSRPIQFVMAFLGCLALQKGPLWWAGVHRKHHKYSDTFEDPHDHKKGFWWSHVLWFMSCQYDATDWKQVKDWAKYPELRWINQHFLVTPLLLIFIFWWVGGGTLVIDYFVATVASWHATFFINSLSHMWGTRRYETDDTSRNHWFLALLTLGEGWHNNHHHYMSSTRQGFYWWEIDVTYYTLRIMAALRLVSDLRPVPPEMRDVRN